MLNAILKQLLYRSVILWRAFQYRTGLRKSLLVWPFQRPDAPYRVVVFGLDPAHWADFDSAYPEYEKAFAPWDAHFSDLRNVLRDRRVALIAFDGVPLRRLRMIAPQGVAVFHGSFSPIPLIERGGQRATGFMIDTIGPWQVSRRPTELGMYLGHLDLDQFPDLSVKGRGFLERSPAPPTGPGQIEIGDQAGDEALSDTDHSSSVRPDYLIRPWYDARATDSFLDHINGCDKVIVDESPLGLMAILWSRTVVVRGNPCWAGFGLTRDQRQSPRGRRLAPEELTGIIVMCVSRYVDSAQNLIDPADGWHLPTRSEETARKIGFE